MNRAFVKDAEETLEPLPDREIPPHPNLVTEEGLAQIERELAAATAAVGEAQATSDREASARAAREQRYWTQRRSSAQLVPPPSDHSQVRFGARVTVVRDDDRKQTFRIVGVDEADPAHGTLSYVSPMAQALMNCTVGDVVRVSGAEIEVVGIA